jgi:cardiolipin synthase A/B
MRMELLVGAAEFWERMRVDLDDARRSVWVQTFTFEGDRVGRRLARALERCGAPQRRLLIDGYSLLYHSDRLIPGAAWLDRRFRREVHLTHRWVRRLRLDGAGVRFGNPLGPSPLSVVRRNHKKVGLFDQRIAYVGGINFSDHNFAWHDMMLRIESPELGRLLAAEAEGAWRGRAEAFDRSVGPLRIISLNGRGNARGFRPVIEAIDGARRSIDVVSAYLSHPFTEHLARAARRGVAVRILTPLRNNKANLARHVLRCAARHGFEVLRYSGGMSHMKAMVIDDEMLVAGSSNFDFMSHHVLEEHVLMTREASIVEEFRRRVWSPEAERAVRRPARTTVGTVLGDAAVRLGAAVAARLALPAGGDA